MTSPFNFEILVKEKYMLGDYRDQITIRLYFQISFNIALSSSRC